MNKELEKIQKICKRITATQETGAYSRPYSFYQSYTILLDFSLNRLLLLLRLQKPVCVKTSLKSCQRSGFNKHLQSLHANQSQITRSLLSSVTAHSGP